MGFDNIDRKHVGKGSTTGFEGIDSRHKKPEAPQRATAATPETFVPGACPSCPPFTGFFVDLAAGCPHKWILRGGKACGCDLGECSFPVHDCELCGDCDYGDNPEAMAIKAGCEALKGILG